MRKTYDADRGVCRFEFDGLPSLSVNVHGEFSPEIVANLTCHGALQKIGDAAAIDREKVPGRRVTEQMRRDAVAAMIAQLKNGDWDKPREGGFAVSAMLFEALRSLFPEKSYVADLGAFRDWLEAGAAKSGKPVRDVQAALMGRADVAKWISEHSGVDTESMLED